MKDFKTALGKYTALMTYSDAAEIARGEYVYTQMESGIFFNSGCNKGQKYFTTSGMDGAITFNAVDANNIVTKDVRTLMGMMEKYVEEVKESLKRTVLNSQWLLVRRTDRELDDCSCVILGDIYHEGIVVGNIVSCEDEPMCRLNTDLVEANYLAADDLQALTLAVNTAKEYK